MDIERHQTPVAPALARELLDFWREVYGMLPDAPLNALLGGENDHNRMVVYSIRVGGELAGTAALTTSRALPALGGLGEVATGAPFRRRGVARVLCEAARDEFADAGGQAVFLATSNPGAARIYRRLGWQRLANTNIMAWTTDERSPEEFLVDYFREDFGRVTVGPASAAERIPMIPLVAVPHDEFVLDANAKFYSTRYALQGSCMGQYGRCDALRAAGRGEWWAARAQDGRPVGMATAVECDGGAVRLDAFTHPRATSAWAELIRSACEWSGPRAVRMQALVCGEDELKRARFEAAGFHEVAREADGEIGGQTVRMCRLER